MSTDRNRRRRDPRDWVILRAIPALLIVAAVAAITALWAYRVSTRATEASARATEASRQVQIAVRRIVLEGEERRDQTCKLFETQHLADVKRLRNTYSYLGNLPVAEWGTTVTVAIVQGLRDLERDARTDSAPPYCDEPGALAEARGAKPIGLPEPDPKVPHHRDFSALLHRP